MEDDERERRLRDDLMTAERLRVATSRPIERRSGALDGIGSLPAQLRPHSPLTRYFRPVSKLYRRNEEKEDEFRSRHEVASSPPPLDLTNDSYFYGGSAPLPSPSQQSNNANGATVATSESNTPSHQVFSPPMSPIEQRDEPRRVLDNKFLNWTQS